MYSSFSVNISNEFKISTSESNSSYPISISKFNSTSLFFILSFFLDNFIYSYFNAFDIYENITLSSSNLFSSGNLFIISNKCNSRSCLVSSQFIDFEILFIKGLNTFIIYLNISLSPFLYSFIFL